MVKYIPHPFILVFYIVLSSCNQHDETYNREIPKNDSISGTPQVSLENYSQDFQELLKSQEGIFRGIRLGLSREEIKKIEDGYENSKLDEETAISLDYMVDFGSLENTELRYSFSDRGNLTGIDVYIYPHSKAAQDSLYSEFESYFSKVYGPSTDIGPDQKKWELKNNDLLIQMQKKGTQKVHDISITFSYLSRQSAGVLIESLPESY